EQHAAIVTLSSVAAWTIQPLLRLRSTRGSFRILFPLSGGVSTVVIEESLLGPAAERITRYVRAIPAGPATPLALAPTVFRGNLEFGLSYRTVRRGIGDPEELLSTVVETLAAFSAQAESAGSPTTKISEDDA